MSCVSSGVQLLTASGLAGRIAVRDYAGMRWLENAGALQALAQLSPDSRSVDPALPQGPGPVLGCTYTLGWLAAGATHRRGRGVMLGLGGGEGPIALLHQFPELNLTVVEIDPAMIAAARQAFPLVQYYESRGRLEIACACAEEWLMSAAPADFLICDIDPGGASYFSALGRPEFSESMKRVSPNLWVNIIDVAGGARERGTISSLRHCGMTPSVRFSCEPRTRNQILTTARVDPAELQRFVPYSQFQDGAVTEIRRRYRRFIATMTPVLDPEERPS